MKNKYSQERVQSIMNSLDSIQPAMCPDFFYTRLKATMQPEEKQKTFLMLRPAFIASALSLFLAVNIFSLFIFNKEANQYNSLQNDKPATIESFAKAYDLNTEYVYE
jgi:hypothetical protein